MKKLVKIVCLLWFVECGKDFYHYFNPLNPACPNCITIYADGRLYENDIWDDELERSSKFYDNDWD